MYGFVHKNNVYLPSDYHNNDIIKFLGEKILRNKTHNLRQMASVTI